MDLSRQRGLGSPWVTVANLCGRNNLGQAIISATHLGCWCMLAWLVDKIFVFSLHPSIHCPPTWTGWIGHRHWKHFTWDSKLPEVLSMQRFVTYQMIYHIFLTLSDLNLCMWRHGGHSYLQETVCVLAECRFTIHYGHHCVFIINVSWKIRCLAKLTNSLKLKSFKLSNLVQDNYFYPLSIMLKNDSSGTRRLFKQMF